jgi:hypothetical protein
MKAYSVYKEGISQGLLQKFMECPEKALWDLEGVVKLHQPERVTTLFGLIAHEVLHRAYAKPRTKPPGPKLLAKWLSDIESDWHYRHPRAAASDISELDLALDFAQAVMPVYFKRYVKDFKLKWVVLEQWFEINVKFEESPHAVKIWGRIDGLHEAGQKWVLFESKTKARIDTEFLTDWLDWDIQTGIYCWAVWKKTGRRPTHLDYNLIRRPQLRLKKGESSGEFVARCVDDVKKRPEFYFFRIRKRVNRNKFYATNERLLSAVRHFVLWRQGKAPHYRVSGACENKYGVCDMFEACAGRMDIYTKGERKLIQLEGEMSHGAR